MTDRDAFIRAICSAPEDDTVRLVFADWLEEHGEEERAEFIRVQIELAQPILVTRDEMLAETYPREAAVRAGMREKPRRDELRRREVVAWFSCHTDLLPVGANLTGRDIKHMLRFRWEGTGHFEATACRGF